MAEPLRSADILKNNPVITLGGKPESGMDGRTLYLKDPAKYAIDGKPLTEFKLLGKGALTDTGVTSARINALVYKGKAPYYADVLLPDRPAGESILWNVIGAVTMVDGEGNKVIIPRSDLRLGKPKDQTRPTGQPLAPGFDEQFSDDDGGPEIKPLSQSPVTLPSLPAQPESRATGTRYIDTEAVGREALEQDTHFQEVLTKMRDVVQEMKQLRKDLDDMTVLPAIAEQIREVGRFSDPTKASDPQYQALMAAMNSRGLRADEALLASEYLLDRTKRQANELAISEWTKAMQAKGDTKDLRRSVLDMVEHTGEGSVRFSKDAVEMSMTGDERNAGYQDLRAAQVTSDYLLDTYDATARKRWVDQHGRLTDAGLRERREYHTLLAQMLRGEVPADKQELAAKLRVKFDELRTLSPDDAVARYQGFSAQDKKNIAASVARWRTKHGVEPYRSADLDLMATKGLLLIERRSIYPTLYETTDVFYQKALKESGTPTSRPTTPSAEAPAAAPAAPAAEPLPATVPAAPSPEPVPPTPTAPAKEEPEAEEKPPKSGVVPTFEKVQASFVAVKGDIRKDQDVAALEARLIARQAMEEQERQYNPKGVREWLSTAAARIWKHNWWEVAYTSRERIHALLSQEKAGMEGIPLQLKYEIRKKALEEAGRRVEARQASSRHRNLERFKNWWSDAEGYFTEEHKESLTVLGEWKTELTKLDDRTVPQAEKDRIMAHNPLHEARLASWNQSYKIADNIAQQVLHGERGEQKFAETLMLAKDSAVGRRLLNEVAKPFWEGLDSAGDVGLSEAQAREKLDEIFASAEFRTLLSTLPADKQALLASRSYANTLMETFKGIHEQVRAASDHQDALKRLDFDIELTLGVAEYGARNKVESTFGERRSKKNKELLQKLRNRDPLFSAAILAPAGHRAELLAEVGNDAIRNEMVWSVLVSGGAMAAMRGVTSSAGRVLTPLGLGGLVGGLWGGRKEWVRLGREHKLHNLETALGYAFPQTYEQRRFLFAGDVISKKTRRGEMEQRSYHQRSMSELIGRMEAAMSDPGQARELLSLLIDTEARNRLSDRRDINLLMVKPEDPTAPHVPFEAQKRDLDRIAAQAKALLGTSPALDLTPLQAPGQTKDFAGLFDELVELHYGTLEKEAGIMDTRYQTALGTLNVAQGQSMEQRDKDFKKFRMWRTAVVGAKTAAFGAATGAVLREAYDLAGSVVQYGQTGQWQWHGPISTGIGHLIDRFGGQGGAAGLPLSPEAEVVHGVSDVGGDTWGVMRFSEGVKVDGGNLVLDDGKGHVETLIKNFEPHFHGNGQLTAETIDQLKAVGVSFDKTQLWSDVVSSGTHPITVDGHQYLVPKELTLINDGGNYSLVMDGLHDKAGNALPPVVVMEHVDVAGGNIQNAREVIDVFDRSHWLERVPGGAHFGAPVPDTIPDVNAMIPPGTHLVQTGAHTFNLVSDTDPKDVLLHKMTFDPDTGKFTNIADPAVQKEINLHNLFVNETETAGPGGPGGGDGTFDIRAGFLDDQTRYMGHNTVWEWGERTLSGDAGKYPNFNADDNLFKNAFRAWHHWNGADNADIAQAEVPGVTRLVHRVAGGFKMSDGNVGYENSLDFNRASDNLYIRDIPTSLFSDDNVGRIGNLMEDTIKEADAWQAANPGADVNAVLAHLQATDELQYLAYKHGYIGQYFTESDWDRFRELFEEPAGAPPASVWQTTITQGGGAWGVKADIVENVLTYGPGGGPTGPIPPWPVVPIIGRRPLEAPERKVAPPEAPPYPEYPDYSTYPEYASYLPLYPEYRAKDKGEYQEFKGYPEYEPSLSNPDEYVQFIPVYEQIYQTLNLPDTQKNNLRKLPPEIRLKTLRTLQGLPIEETGPYEELFNTLASSVGINPENTTGDAEFKKIVKRRLRAQKQYLQRLQRLTPNSKNTGVLRTLFRINGAKKSYIEQLEELNSGLPSMHKDCQLSVVIPAYNEEKKIERTIKGWIEQFQASSDKPVNPNSFEIIVFINRPNPNKPYDNTRQRIEALKQNPKYKQYYIYVVEKTFNISDADKQVILNGINVKIPKGRRMGIVYGLPSDLAVLRNMQRDTTDERKANHILKAGGADVYGRDPYYVDEVTQTFANNPLLEQYNSRADYPTSVFEHVPLFHVTERFREMMNLQFTEGKSNLGLGTYRMALYSEAGGFNPADEIAEEVRLNERMRKVATKKASESGRPRKEHIRRDSIMRAIDDPRRALAAVWQGTPMLYSYGNFWNNRAIQSMDVNEILSKPVPPRAQLTTENLSHQVEPYVRYYARMIYLHDPDRTVKGNIQASIEKARKLSERTLGFLGFKKTDYRWRFDTNISSTATTPDINEAVKHIKISFNSLDNINQLLKEYPNRAKPQWIT